MKNGITEYFEDVELYEEYDGYFCSVPDIITIVIIGSICGLRNIHQIHQWAANDRVSKFLKEKFGINHVPCYYWILSLLKYVRPESLNRCFVDWVYSFMPEKSGDMTISLDGKTICSTLKMEKIKSPLHIISAQVSELGLTLAQRCTDDKSNEIRAVQELLKELKIKGQMVVADALNCQKETAEIIVDQKADYLLCVKDNHPNLKKNIADFVQDTELRETMCTLSKSEKNRGRIETRTAYVTTEIVWLDQEKEWKKLRTIGAIHSEFITKKGTSDEWHYYLSSRELTPEELLHHARMEWSVEAMHWLLDVHFEEDWCRVANKDVQQCLNMFRKAAINLIKNFKIRNNSKTAISNIMFECLMNPQTIFRIVSEN